MEAGGGCSVNKVVNSSMQEAESSETDTEDVGVYTRADCIPSLL